MTTTILRPNRCETCACSTPRANNAPLLDCRARAPTMTAVLVPADRGGRLMWQQYTDYPAVKAEQWCIHDFKPRIEKLNS